MWYFDETFANAVPDAGVGKADGDTEFGCDVTLGDRWITFNGLEQAQQHGVVVTPFHCHHAVGAD
jgi:hypothetical protein